MSTENKKKILKILKGAAIASGGVFMTYILQEISHADFDQYTAIVAALSSILINAVKQITQSTHE